MHNPLSLSPLSLSHSLSVLGEDYNHVAETVTMPRCGRVVCTTVVIINDKSVENREESFVVNLEINSLRAVGHYSGHMNN